MTCVSLHLSALDRSSQQGQREKRRAAKSRRSSFVGGSISGESGAAQVAVRLNSAGTPPLRHDAYAPTPLRCISLYMREVSCGRFFHGRTED